MTMSPENLDGMPLWRRIATTLEQEIRTSVLKPGDKIPTEWELTERFGVNRHTVRRALAALADAGIIRAEQGRGTFVQQGLIDYHITRRTRFSETIRAQEHAPRGEIIDHSEDKADQRIASALRISAGTPVIVMEILRFADSHAISLTTHLFEKRRFPLMVNRFQESGSISKGLASYGVSDYTRGRTRVSSRLPSPDETRLLKLPKNRPLIVTEAVDLDLEGQPVVFGTARFPADRVHLVFEP